MPLLGLRTVFTPTLLACYGITAAVHLASIVLNTLLPFHVVDLGGTKTQVGLLFSVMTIVSMFLRPTVGGWVDRFGARPVIAPGIAALALTSLALQLATTPVAIIVLMVGLGIANGLITTPASVLTALSTPAAHRGEALGTYYLAGSLGIAVGPPLAFGLRALGGMRLALAVVVAFAVLLAVIVARLPANVAGPAAADQPLGARGVLRARALHDRSQLGVRVPAALCRRPGTDGGPRVVLRHLSRVADHVARAAARRVGPPRTPARERVRDVGAGGRLPAARAAAHAALAGARRPRPGQRQRAALSHARRAGRRARARSRARAGVGHPVGGMGPRRRRGLGADRCRRRPRLVRRGLRGRRGVLGARRRRAGPDGRAPADGRAGAGRLGHHPAAIGLEHLAGQVAARLGGLDDVAYCALFLADEA